MPLEVLESITYRNGVFLPIKTLRIGTFLSFLALGMAVK
jgi:hypothetical protein